MTLPARKKKALLASGTLNPRPQAVNAKLFTDYAFFDPHDRAQVKYEMLRAKQIEALSVSEVCRQFGFSREGFYQVQKAFTARGFSSLLPAKRGRKGPNKLKGEVLQFVLEQHQQQPELDPARLAELIVEHYDLKVHRTTVMRALKKKRRTPAASRRVRMERRR